MRKKKSGSTEDDRSLDASAAPAGSPSRDGRLTPLDIQQVEFRRAFKGYEEREVDEFLDRLTEDFAAALEENQRLRQRADTGLGAVGAADPAAASRQADEIIQRARDDAARIVREAEQRAASISSQAPIGPADAAAISAFITKERAFLQQLASLVQDHAEGVKLMVRDSRASATADASGRSADRAASAAAPTSEATKSASSPAPGASSSGAAPAAASAAAGSTAATDAGVPQPTPAEKERQRERPTERIEPVEESSASAGEPSPPASEERATSAGSETIAVPEPEPARPGPSRTTTADEDPAGDERSLRELFWGDE